MAGKKTKKIILIAVKLTIAVVLLGWVLSKVHWDNYVVSQDGKSSYAVIGRVDGNEQRLRLSEGMLWWKKESAGDIADFKPISEGSEVIIRPGFAKSMKGINVPLLLCGIFGFLLPILIFSVRWWFLLRIQEIKVGLWETIRLTFLGLFFNYIVPGLVGGDLVKAWYVSKHTKKKAAVLVSIFVDRILGLTELVFMAGVMLCVVWGFGLESVDKLKTAAITVAVVVCMVILAMAFLLSAKFRKIFHLQAIYKRTSFAHHIEAMGDAAGLYKKKIRTLTKAVLITIGGHIIWIGSIAIIGYSLHLNEHGIAWYSYFLYVPLIYIIGAIPLSPGGVGLIEELFVIFFAVVSPSQILPLALLARLIPMFWSLPGAIVAMTGAKLPKTEQMQAEMDAAEQAELATVKTGSDIDGGQDGEDGEN